MDIQFLESFNIEKNIMRFLLSFISGFALMDFILLYAAAIQFAPFLGIPPPLNEDQIWAIHLSLFGHPLIFWGIVSCLILMTYVIPFIWPKKCLVPVIFIVIGSFFLELYLTKKMLPGGFEKSQWIVSIIGFGILINAVITGICLTILIFAAWHQISKAKAIVK